MIALLIGVCGALGVFYLYTAAIGWKGVGLAPVSDEPRPNQRRTFTEWMTQAGIEDVTPVEFVVATVAVSMFMALLAYVVFGALLPSIAIGLLGTTAPAAAYRARRTKLRAAARESWPRVIEEIRVQTSSIGRSVPVALLDVGSRSTIQPMRLAFEAANREWLLTTDFARTVSVLKQRLADPAADAVCETLLVAHDLGGSDLDRRLRSLIDDRTADLEERRDAVSRQSGVKFARWFTLVVPLGMAAVGMSIGNGRASYRTPTGQIALLLAVFCTAACWTWAGRIMTLPTAQRVLDK
jgi:tight adherence protein B